MLESVSGRAVVSVVVVNQVLIVVLKTISDEELECIPVAATSNVSQREISQLTFACRADCA